MSTNEKSSGGLTGRHVLGIFIGAFGVIITVNLFMAYNAVSSFPGIEARNGYSASQNFDARRDAQEALGWQVEAVLEADEIRIAIIDAEGRPVQAGAVQALVGRPATDREDFAPELIFDGREYRAPAELGAGRWIMKLRAQTLDGQPFEQRLNIRRAS